MNLENIVTALKHSMNGTLEEIDEDLLGEKDVQDTLTTFFAEQQTRPELVAQIRAPSLMYGYLQLSLEERSEIGAFKENYPEYLKGKGRTIKRLDTRVDSSNSHKFIKKCRSVEQLLIAFDNFFQHRKIGDIFNSSYLKLNKTSNELGENLLAMAYNIFPRGEGFKKMVAIAAEISPKIQEYSTYEGVFRNDAPNQLLIFFDHYLSQRKPGQIFNIGYIRRRLKGSFANSGQRFAASAFTYFNGKGCFKRVVDLAAQQRPEIYMYTTNQAVFEKDGVKSIQQLFDSYIEERKKGNLRGVIFGPTYIRKNWQDFELYNRARRRKQGWVKLFQLATEERQEINKYASDRELLRIEAPEELIKIFDFYLAHNQDQKFNVGYLQNNLLLKERYGQFSHNLYNRIIKNFRKEGGIDYIVQLAAQQRPEILEYWKYDEKKGRRKTR